MDTITLGEGVMGAGLIGMLIALGVIAILIALAIYVYSSLAVMKIAKDRKHKRPWLAWIPVANLALIFQLGGFHWAWIFLILIPILGWIVLGVMAIISFWKICESAGYPGFYGLAPLLDIIIGGIGSILTLVLIGFIAWGKKSKKVASSKPKKKSSNKRK